MYYPRPERKVHGAGEFARAFDSAEDFKGHMKDKYC